MKKSIAAALVLVFLLTFTAAPALAAGRINVVQENYYTIKEYSSYYGYVFARVENNGNKPIKVNAALLETFNEEGDAITSTDRFSSYARYLEPGEYTYLRMSSEMADISAPEAVDDYMLTVSGKSDLDQQCVRLECKPEYRENEKDGYSTYNYMYGTVTNNTDEIVYKPCVVFALLDADDNILYVAGDSLDSNQALLPGSSILFKISVDSDFVSYMEANGLTPASLDAIGYCIVDK